MYKELKILQCTHVTRQPGTDFVTKSATMSVRTSYNYMARAGLHAPLDFFPSMGYGIQRQNLLDHRRHLAIVCS